MTPTLIADTGAGLVYEDTDAPSRAELLSAARAYLVEHGVHELDAEDKTVDHPGLIARAFWSDEDGIVQEGYVAGRQVRIVHVFVPEIVKAQDAAHIAAEALRMRLAAAAGDEVIR